MSASPARNDPCPCGSGLKYKNCCARKRKLMVGRVGGVPYWALALGAIVVIAVAIYFGTRPRTPAASSASAGPARVGKPWEYDAATNTHWDPTHGHWHDGPPPANAGGVAADSAPAIAFPGAGAPGAAGPTGTLTPSSTPAPYQYDPATNRHWDPAHGHWHDGPPPTGAATRPPRTTPSPAPGPTPADTTSRP